MASLDYPAEKILPLTKALQWMTQVAEKARKEKGHPCLGGLFLGVQWLDVGVCKGL
jgi:hypothetical protein